MDLGGHTPNFQDLGGAVSNAILYNNILLFYSRGGSSVPRGGRRPPLAPPKCSPGRSRYSATGKLESLDAEYESIHFEIIDLLDDSDDLEKEQTVLDKNDDDVSTLTIRLQTLSTPKTTEAPSTMDPQRPLSRKLARLEKGLHSIDSIISSTAEAALERSMIQQCNEQLSDYKGDLAALYDEILSNDIDDEDELVVLHSRLEKSV